MEKNTSTMSSSTTGKTPHVSIVGSTSLTPFVESLHWMQHDYNASSAKRVLFLTSSPSHSKNKEDDEDGSGKGITVNESGVKNFK